MRSREVTEGQVVSRSAHPRGPRSPGGPGPRPDGGVEVGHGDLLGALHRRGHLLLVLLGQERQHLDIDIIDMFRYYIDIIDIRSSTCPMMALILFTISVCLCISTFSP